jgi:cytosine deaminase
VTALDDLPDEKLMPIIEKISRAGITVISLPATDLHLGGRADSCRVRRTLAPIRKLRDGGVNVCIASNNIQNAFTPYGNGDLLQIANLAIAAGHLGGGHDLPTVLPMLTKNPAKALHIGDYGLEEGCIADLVLLDSRDPAKAIIDLPQRLAVIKRGRLTVKTEIKTQIYR